MWISLTKGLLRSTFAAWKKGFGQEGLSMGSCGAMLAHWLCL